MKDERLKTNITPFHNIMLTLTRDSAKHELDEGRTMLCLISNPVQKRLLLLSSEDILTGWLYTNPEMDQGHTLLKKCPSTSQQTGSPSEKQQNTVKHCKLSFVLVKVIFLRMTFFLQKLPYS